MRIPLSTIGRAAALSLALAFNAQAAVITTSFAGGNSASGNMFDVTTASNSLLITGLNVHLDRGTHNLLVYTKAGTHVGFETNAGAWTLQSTSLLVTGQGLGTPTFVDIDDFLVPGGALTGWYVTTDIPGTGGPMFYSNGSSLAANADLSLNLTTGISGLFGGGNGVFRPRTWNGSIFYDVQTVPTSGTLALLGLGLSVLAFRRRANLG